MGVELGLVIPVMYYVMNLYNMYAVYIYFKYWIVIIIKLLHSSIGKHSSECVQSQEVLFVMNLAMVFKILLSWTASTCFLQDVEKIALF